MQKVILISNFSDYGLTKGLVGTVTKSSRVNDSVDILHVIWDSSELSGIHSVVSTHLKTY